MPMGDELFRPSLSEPLEILENWLTGGARAPIPPCVEWPNSNAVCEFKCNLDYSEIFYQSKLDELKDEVANNQTLLGTYNQRVDEFCLRQNQIRAEVLATAQAIRQRIKVCREDGDLTGLAAVMQDLMAFLFRRVCLVGMSSTRKHMVLAVESRR